MNVVSDVTHTSHRSFNILNLWAWAGLGALIMTVSVWFVPLERSAVFACEALVILAILYMGLALAHAFWGSRGLIHESVISIGAPICAILVGVSFVPFLPSMNGSLCVWQALGMFLKHLF